MSNDEIKELIQLVIESGVAELEVQRGENRVRIRRSAVSPPDVIVPPSVIVPPTMVSPSPTPLPNAVIQAPPPNSAAAPAPASTDVIVKSPIVGTFYEAPKPGDPPFVKVGDAVEPGQVLCIIESMKLMNEIEAEVAGTVVARLMENGRPVEYGEALFTIRPR